MKRLIPALVLFTMSIDMHSIRAQAPGFGGLPKLEPADDLRQLQKPYDLVKLNVLAGNYNENLLDMRVGFCAYTHRLFNTPTNDAWHLQFADDSARFVEALAWEDQFSPVVRLEAVRRIMKGMLAARLPGTFSDISFRHRGDGKTFLIFGDEKKKDGRMMLSMWGDDVYGMAKVGFRAKHAGQWSDIDAFTYSDPPDSAAHSSNARFVGSQWNESPVTIKREFQSGDTRVTFSGRYWLSDEDKPLEFAFSSDNAEEIQIVIGGPETGISMLNTRSTATFIDLPDRKTTFSSQGRDGGGRLVFDKPDFHYFILRNPLNSWAIPGYSTALLVMWDGDPGKIEVLSDKGFDEVRITYPASGGKVWLYPYLWLDDIDIGLVFRSAEQFLAKGTLLQNRFPSQQLLNAVPAGLAAGAYLLTRYNDPMAPTARINAERAVKRLFAEEHVPNPVLRHFFAVKAAAWMVKTEAELGNSDKVKYYTGLLAKAMDYMCSPAYGYDGKGWTNLKKTSANGWEHFNCAKACWLAYDATGNPEYLKAYERALTVYTIDEKGIYRYGEKLSAPGGEDTYAGALPMALWGHTGKLDMVNSLINLDVPGGWHNHKVTVREMWNDAGGGPWACDDSNPDFLGFSLRGANLPQARKFILPVGSFPDYDASGEVKVTKQPVVDNPFFLQGTEPVQVVRSDEIGKSSPYETTTLDVVPGTDDEKRHLVAPVGNLSKGGRSIAGMDAALVYRFDIKDSDGAAIDFRIKGGGYKVEVSPDGKQWFERLDTFDPEVANQSLDVSFLAGSHEELLRMDPIVPPEDSRFLVEGSDSVVEREHCRYLKGDSQVIYKLDFPNASSCWLELMLGNGYQVECSSDGKTWRPALSSTDVDDGSGQMKPDQAWIRMLDVTPCLKEGSSVYLRVTDRGNPEAFSGRSAFVRRMVRYVTFRSGEVWVRISNVSEKNDNSLTLERIGVRKWVRLPAERE